MPTILDMAGIAHPEQYEGRKVRPMQGGSVLDLFAGSAELTLRGSESRRLRALRLEGFLRWRLEDPVDATPVRYGANGNYSTSRKTLRRLDDLSREYPEKVEEMVALWEQYKKDNGVLDIALDLAGKIK